MRSSAGEHPLTGFFTSGAIIDYAPKDDPEMMQRPFFSLSKRKRNKAIEYTSPDGTVWVRVEANPLHGMATIWDADILIWCLSRLMARHQAGENDIDGVIHTTPYELLRGIARDTGGEDYRRLMAALTRLMTTRVETNIRKGRRQFASFHYIDSVEGASEDAQGEELKSISIRVPDWLLQGVKSGSVLTLDREYFLLKGGIERAIYRAARKHAGSQAQGWTCRVSVLHEKTGSEAALKMFAFKVRELCQRDELPRYAMTDAKTEGGEAAIHFVDRQFIAAAEARERRASAVRLARDQARTAWIDGGHNPRQFEAAYEDWCELNHPVDFAKSLSAPRLL